MRKNRIKISASRIPVFFFSVQALAGTSATPAISNARGTMNSDFLNSSSVIPSPTQKVSSNGQPQDKGPRDSRSRALQESSLGDTGNIAKYSAAVSGLTLILENIQPSPKRTKLIMNRAAARTQLARSRILSTKGNALPPEAKKDLELALLDCDEVLKAKFREKDSIWRAYETRGLDFLYLNEPVRANEAFNAALQNKPPPERAGKIALLIAEDLFDNRKYADAAGYYEKYLPIMIEKWRDLAWYKLGWCMVNLNRIEDAERDFVKVISSKSKSEISKDALRDLAYLATHQKDVPQTLKRLESGVIPSWIFFDFLVEVRPNLEAGGLSELHGALVDRLLKTEQNSERRFEFMLADFRVQRRPSASSQHFLAFRRIGQALSKLDKAQYKTIYAKFESEIDTETQAIMKSYLDTFSGRMHLENGVSREQVIAGLKELFQFYHRHFYAKKNLQQVLVLWSDLCLTTHDDPGLEYVSEIVIRDPKRFPTILERAYLDEFGALETLMKDSNSPGYKVREKRRLIRMREFVGVFPDSPKWLAVSRIYSQLEMDQGHFKLVLPLLETIVKRSLTDEDYYRLQFARFKNGDFAKILGDDRGKAFIAANSKVIEIYRESALNLAMRAKEMKDVDQYRNDLNWFYYYSKDSQKRGIARVDYFRYLISRGLHEDAVKELMIVPTPDRDIPELEPIRVELWTWTVEEGKYEAAQKLLESPAAYLSHPEWGARRNLTSRLSGHLPTPNELMALSAPDREGLLGTLALIAPDQVIAYARSLKKGALDSERPSIALAFKVSLDQVQLVRTRELEGILGSQYPFIEDPEAPLSALEAQMKSVKIPDLSKVSPKKQGKLAEAAFTQVRGVRDQIAEGIRGKNPEVKIRILKQAAELESNVAKMLLNSPVPEGLESAQVEEYQKGIASAAAEFQQQSEQFTTLVNSIRQEVSKMDDELEKRTLPGISNDKWNWPSFWKKDSSTARALFDSGNVFGALTFLDFQRSTRTLEDADYFMARTGVLLGMKGANRALRHYLLDELQVNQQRLVVIAWAKLAQKPIPEAKK